MFYVELHIKHGSALDTKPRYRHGTYGTIRPSGQKSKVVIVTEESLLTTVTALGEMMRVVGGDDPWDSSHVL